MAIQQGWSQMTPATQNTIRRAIGTVRRVTSRKTKRTAGKRKTSRKAGKKRVAKGTKKLARMVAGSAAAKRYMSKIRKLRKKN